MIHLLFRIAEGEGVIGWISKEDRVLLRFYCERLGNSFHLPVILICKNGECTAFIHYHF